MGPLEFFEPMRIPLATHNGLVAHVGADGRPGIHKKAELVRAEGAWESHLGLHAPERPFEGPVAVQLAICADGRQARPGRAVHREAGPRQLGQDHPGRDEGHGLLP